MAAAKEAIDDPSLHRPHDPLNPSSNQRKADPLLPYPLYHGGCLLGLRRRFLLELLLEAMMGSIYKPKGRSQAGAVGRSSAASSSTAGTTRDQLRQVPLLPQSSMW